MRKKQMLSRSLLPLTTLLVVACGATSSTAGVASPSPALRPKVVSQNRLATPGVTGTFDLVQQVVEYPPASFSVKHSHAGPVLITVLEGEMTMRAEGGDSTVTAGKTFSEVPGKVYQAGNSSSAPVKWVADIFVPAAAAVSAPVAGATPVGPAVTPTFTYRWKGLSQSGSYDLVQLVQDFEPGARTPKHKHGGAGVITVIAGELTLRANGSETVYKAGESFIEEAGQVIEGSNAGSTKARTVASFLLPTGVELTTVVK